MDNENNDTQESTKSQEAKLKALVERLEAVPVQKLLDAADLMQQQASKAELAENARIAQHEHALVALEAARQALIDQASATQQTEAAHSQRYESMHDIHSAMMSRDGEREQFIDDLEKRFSNIESKIGAHTSSIEANTASVNENTQTQNNLISDVRAYADNQNKALDKIAAYGKKAVKQISRLENVIDIVATTALKIADDVKTAVSKYELISSSMVKLSDNTVKVYKLASGIPNAIKGVSDKVEVISSSVEKESQKVGQQATRLYSNAKAIETSSIKLVKQSAELGRNIETLSGNFGRDLDVMVVKAQTKMQDLHMDLADAIRGAMRKSLANMDEDFEQSKLFKHVKELMVIVEKIENLREELAADENELVSITSQSTDHFKFVLNAFGSSLDEISKAVEPIKNSVSKSSVGIDNLNTKIGETLATVHDFSTVKNNAQQALVSSIMDAITEVMTPAIIDSIEKLRTDDNVNYINAFLSPENNNNKKED